MSQMCDLALSQAVDCDDQHKPKNDGEAQNVVAQPSNLRICSICHSAPARYKCPACSAMTCSCSCVKKHKLQAGCTGIREPVPAVQKEEMDDEMLQRDYRFLESVLSRLQRSLRDTRVHHLNENINPYKRRNEQQRKKREEEESLVFKHRFSQSSIENDDVKRRFKAVIPNYGGRGRRYEGVTFYRADIPSAFKKLRYEAKERGTHLAFMPRDMSRHSANTSHYSFKCRAIRWRVRVEFVQANVYFEATFDENISIGRIVSKFVSCALHELRGWNADELCGTPRAEPLHAREKVMCNARSCQEDPLKDYWSEGVVSMKNNTDVPLHSLPETRKCLKSGQKCEVLQHTRVNAEEIRSTEKEQQSKKTLISFANEDVIKMTLNSFCDSTGATYGTPEGPLAVDVTREPKINHPKPLNDSQKDQILMYQAVGIPQLSVLFKNENFYDNKRYLEMCVSDSLKESLSGLRVVEYPILSVFMKDHAHELASVKEDVHVTVNEADSGNHIEDKTFKYFDAECTDDFMDENLPFNFE
ncbi:Zinc finger HIT-type [Trinorchestia longiramus]|nr:Zinc finger HIT-type [Trinorchestia longiramus]